MFSWKWLQEIWAGKGDHSLRKTHENSVILKTVATHLMVVLVIVQMFASCTVSRLPSSSHTDSEQLEAVHAQMVCYVPVKLFMDQDLNYFLLRQGLM